MYMQNTVCAAASYDAVRIDLCDVYLKSRGQ